jgi:hypothetical protein
MVSLEHSRPQYALGNQLCIHIKCLFVYSMVRRLAAQFPCLPQEKLDIVTRTTFWGIFCMHNLSTMRRTEYCDRYVSETCKHAFTELLYTGYQRRCIYFRSPQNQIIRSKLGAWRSVNTAVARRHSRPRTHRRLVWPRLRIKRFAFPSHVF